MKPSMRKTLAIALLAGSTLSVMPIIGPAIAQTQMQQGAAGQANPYIPPQGGGSEGSGATGSGVTPGQAAPRQEQPQQNMGAAQQPQGSERSGTDSRNTAQDKSADPRLKQQGDSASQQKPDATQSRQNAESADPKKPRSGDTAQQKPDAQPGTRNGSTTANSGSNADNMRNQQPADSARQNNGGQQPRDAQASTDRPSNEVTGSINISTEQRTEIKQVFVENRVKPAKVDIDINVGISVPTTVELHPLPPRIVEIVPAYRGYEYFVLADGRIIIVQPTTHEVVYILAA